MTVDDQAFIVTGQVQQQAWRDRVLPPVEQVRPGLWSVPTPFPQSPLRYVLAYLLETRRGPVLVDTGWPSEDAWDGLVAGVRATGHEIGDVSAVLITHGHADHFGLARRIRRESGAPVMIHELEVAASHQFASIAEFRTADRIWLRRRGMPAAEIDALFPEGDEPPEWRDPPDVLLQDGDRPLGDAVAVRALWTPGHTPGHLCFVHEEHNVLLTGDHVLPRISPNISPSPRVRADTLGEYLGSLAAIEDMPVDEVLPAHEYRFRGLGARVRQLQAHHRARLREVVEAVVDLDGPTTMAVAERLTWSRPWSESQGIVRRSAVGETYAHLLHLERRGLLTGGAGGEEAGPGQVDAWRPAAEAGLLVEALLR
ncbi:MBL fold metallo-hydrolase [Frankia sp. AvcI1]|uniref:MBL fold metallo-hydrolase n=1 Tax=Frankia sp. AvcI1 TaxID=573496 RepID=UPI002118C335|nr:MBL fold metallo-hydrolase [Frankia sp. AvcI1]